MNVALVASSGVHGCNPITDYNDLYCRFTRCVASRHVNIIISAFVIGENDKQQALLYTAQNSRLNSQWQVL